MYGILIYDIKMDQGGAAVLRKVFKTAKCYMTHIQNSVFEGDLSDVQYLQLKNKLKKHLRVGSDSCIFFKSRSEKWLEKDFFVEEAIDKTDTFL